MYCQRTLPLDREQCQVINFCGVSIWENTPWLREIPRSMKLPDKKPAQFLNTRAASRGSHNCKVSLTDTLREILFDVIPSPVPDLHSTPHKAILHWNFQDYEKFSYLCLQTQGQTNHINLILMLLGKPARREEAPWATVKHGVTPGQGPGSKEQHIPHHRDWAPFFTLQ